MTEEDIKYYQLHLFAVKDLYLTRLDFVENQVLLFNSPIGLTRVTYLRVDPQGLTLRTMNGLDLYADWYNGDLFVAIYDALSWGRITQGVFSGRMESDEYAAWEVPIFVNHA